MKPERFARLRKLLLEASDLPEEQRKAYLEQACEDDPELRHEAESILADGAASSAILRQAGDVPEAALHCLQKRKTEGKSETNFEIAIMVMI